MPHRANQNVPELPLLKVLKVQMPNEAFSQPVKTFPAIAIQARTWRFLGWRTAGRLPQSAHISYQCRPVGIVHAARIISHGHQRTAACDCRAKCERCWLIL